MTKMFEDGQDPWSKIQELEALVHHHHRQLVALEQSFLQIARAFNAHSDLVHQITVQNTQLLQDMAVLREYNFDSNK